ncbi:hypothetical protein POJ06DRAFT_84081 [Lipomyces tetrasporus]|uniref:Uncharacterized protein n=1 Tax=Lipomyces tetrasporus TaxID=54092 RepID=A0AAD7VTE9_9ASCO|nr:uncharacterized protein POJ06DRAFT_84081 [Lipomyces tetrasporus]KAJ8100916.1 hypothetical protein POJ06DRAFT_84081 [Lipomyces tetrasporus]
MVTERLTGYFYLCVPLPLEMVEGPGGIPRVISLDPGVRTFMCDETIACVMIVSLILSCVCVFVFVLRLSYIVILFLLALFVAAGLAEYIKEGFVLAVRPREKTLSSCSLSLCICFVNTTLCFPPSSLPIKCYPALA